MIGPTIAQRNAELERRFVDALDRRDPENYELADRLAWGDDARRTRGLQARIDAVEDHARSRERAKLRLALRRLHELDELDDELAGLNP